jgi:hypothetical protein
MLTVTTRCLRGESSRRMSLAGFACPPAPWNAVDFVRSFHGA